MFFLEHQLGSLFERAQRLLAARFPVAALHQQDEIIAAGLAAPYPGFFTDPDVIAAFPDYYDLPQISKIFATGSKVVPARTLPWYPDFQAKVGDLVHALLLGEATPKKTVEDLTAAATAAQSNKTTL